MSGLKFLLMRKESSGKGSVGLFMIWLSTNLTWNLRWVKKIPATYPLTPIELALPELDGKTEKMYRGGKICLDIHFAPLW